MLNKLRQLMLRPAVRATLGQSQPRFDLSEVFSRRRIVLVSLNKGRLGNDTSRLLGSLILGQLWALTLGRQALPPERRQIASLYIDEVHDFLNGIPGDLADALAQSRSLGLAITMANQYLSQLTPSMRDAIATNARSRIAFTLTGNDAVEMARLADGLDAEDFRTLPTYHAYANLMQNAQATGWMAVKTVPPPPRTSERSDLYAASQERYGRSAVETEAELVDLLVPSASPGMADEGPIGRSKR